MQHFPAGATFRRVYLDTDHVSLGLMALRKNQKSD